MKCNTHGFLQTNTGMDVCACVCVCVCVCGSGWVGGGVSVLFKCHCVANQGHSGALFHPASWGENNRLH